MAGNFEYETGESADNSPLPPILGKPLLEYGDKPPDPGKTILGDRFLCVGGGMLFVGPSGIGKSSASIQQDILWSIGKPAFGIQPQGPLKILTIQAEDDDGDLYEMVQGARHYLELTKEEEALSIKNCIYIPHKTLTGDDLLKKIVQPQLDHRRPQLLRLNPLQAYLGADPGIQNEPQHSSVTG